jgi:hypothetical protein
MVAAISSTRITFTFNHSFRSFSSNTPSNEESNNNTKGYEYILTETRGNVGIITLHRPKALNALCDGLFADLIHAAKSYQSNGDIGCLVLTGSPKAFAAGADISEMKDRSFDYAYQKVRTSMRASHGGIGHIRRVTCFILPLISFFLWYRTCFENGLTLRPFPNQSLQPSMDIVWEEVVNSP